ncbi:hypothetical protein LTR70_004766 [Exophiala xenobiotica]|uniref:Protein-serine/threonine kinase n=1 Tax=Lithohypha guttulata TaxID=1690604 RepID=A0ABR0KCB0_9EURO|nr:hypothetical protein LTR24_004258 [Lithohypha guttulata]KAK5319856.1 hypothetical protein LTR70_004766 [Exophiala xenobiotica]
MVSYAIECHNLGPGNQHGKPPLSDDALLSSANFTLSLLPARLAHRIQRLRNLPFIVVANPHINKIYNNYLHSLSILEPFYQKRISTMEEEEKFTEVMADLVQTHTNTIPTLAQGFLECRKYIDATEITNFLDQHLRARIGTRLIAEQHLALHMASTADARALDSDPYNIGVIDSSLQPARIIRSCEAFVGDICEFKYGVRPKIDMNGSIDATFAHVPVHLEYVLTELIKNAFRATVESGNESHPVEVTLAAAPDVPMSKLDALKQLALADETTLDFTKDGLAEYCTLSEGVHGPINSAPPTITIRIRDRGGGIPPDVLPNIWSYSFTTFNADEAAGTNSVNDGLNAITNGGNPSSIAGLGYGLPLGRAYAEYFGGSIAVQSMHGWGTDVYLSLQGIGKVV